MEVELPETFISSGKYYTIERFNITLSPTVCSKMEIQYTRAIILIPRFPPLFIITPPGVSPVRSLDLSDTGLTGKREKFNNLRVC